ncbi:MAG: septum site-determining protein MinC, partial [Janthinobacterium lividum]
MSKTLARKPIEIKISTVVAIVAILHETELAILNEALTEMTGGNADYFDNEFAVIDLSPIDPARQVLDWTALIALFKSYRLNLVAVRHAAAAIEAGIQAHGLSIDVVSRSRETAAPVEPVAVAAPVP